MAKRVPSWDGERPRRYVPAVRMPQSPPPKVKPVRIRGARPDMFTEAWEKLFERGAFAGSGPATREAPRKKRVTPTRAAPAKRKRRRVSV